MKAFKKLYRDLSEHGKTSAPRGKIILELEDYSFTLEPRERFTAFVPRKLNIDYLKEEFLWYLRADPKDALVSESAQMWRDLRQPDGTFFSNYGVYWFGNDSEPSTSTLTHTGFSWVIRSLLEDKDSRQAVIPMLKKSHLYPNNPDVVCTYAIGFRIRNNELKMSVNMRSQDAIWGLSNDIPCFSFLHEMVYVALRDTSYYNLKMGTYTHKVDSLHVYERHFEMLKELIDPDVEIYPVLCPRILDLEEVHHLVNSADTAEPKSKHRFVAWLMDNKYRRSRNVEQKT